MTSTMSTRIAAGVTATYVRDLSRHAAPAGEPAARHAATRSHRTLPPARTRRSPGFAAISRRRRTAVLEER